MLQKLQNNSDGRRFGRALKREYGIKPDKTLALAPLIYSLKGKSALESLWKEYISTAKKYNLPFMATTPTRRVNKDNILVSEYDEKIIYDNVRFLKQIQKESNIDMFIGALVGCKGDAYRGDQTLTIEESESFHSWETGLFKQAGVDFLFAGIMPILSEAVGMAKAMEKTGLPYIISFMIKKDGKLIDGSTINEAIEAIDSNTHVNPLCYMTNCVHPSVLYKALQMDFNKTPLVQKRFCGIQANTSPLSPEELDGSEELFCSDCKTLAEEIMELSNLIPLKIIGGCCGTDNTHMEQIAVRI